MKVDALRCTVSSWDEKNIYAAVADGTRQGPVSIKMTDADLANELSVGMQLNLLDCTCEGQHITPDLIIIEPDFLLDISAVAACFQNYGHHPITYLLNQLKPRANSQPILLGNFAGTALDDLINREDFQFADTLRSSFREQALQFCTCEGFNAQQFKADGLQQVQHIREAVERLFSNSAEGGEGYQREQALLEPTFVCEKLGLQGRVDLMTDDMRLLIEQKSGKNWYRQAHYVQLLLYYGVLHYNFHVTTQQTDIRLLYSRYPASEGLQAVGFSPALFREAIRLRNLIVCQQIKIAREGFATMTAQLQPALLLQNEEHQDFFHRYISPQIEKLLKPLEQLAPHERQYTERMLTFVYREQLAQKIRMEERQDSATADLWNMTLEEKLETGNIILGTVAQKSPDAVSLNIDTTTGSPNFRRGDAVFLYRYLSKPDVRAHILYKGTLERLTTDEVVVRLNDRQQNPTLFGEGSYAIEHASSDIGTTSSVRSIHAFCMASKQKRNLLLGQTAPRRDASLQLSRSYHPHYDDILLKARQAQDYFLLQGPPGTGKTSMALRFLVEEELINNQASETNSLLLTAYTNRAVDEICGMLEKSGKDYLRLGNKSSCDPCYTHRLLDEALGDQPRLDDIRQRLHDCRIIVATTSTLQARPFILQLKRFSLCIVDEASQILEPSIIGLLASDSIERFILIGDHKQLPAVVQQPDDQPQLHDCRLSLFERLLQQERAAGRTAFVGLLQRQGRMHPDIAAFPNEHFYHQEQLLCVPCPHQEETSLGYEQPAEDALDQQLKEHRVLFLPSETPPPDIQLPTNTQDAKATTDKVNLNEAYIVADLLRRIYRQYGDHFDAQQTVGVIVPYRNQIAMIRHAIARLDIPQLADISIDTVERYQGSQRDVIIYSFTVQHPYQLDFLTATCFVEDGKVIDRKLNVAMTRARRQLLMTGNTNILRQNPLFNELICRFGDRW